ncbi:MAG: hypothetical protein ACOCVF_02560 [bacterium]
MKIDKKKLKLIFVLKVGYNTNDEGLYEFIFSNDITNIAVEDWNWDLSPAIDNAKPPTKEFYDLIVNLKTSSFDLFCLHEAVDREYMHGYHNIHALAYETEKEDNDGFSDYEQLMEMETDLPLLVFHYGMSLETIENMLKPRKFIFKNKEFVQTDSIEFVDD